MNNGTAQRFWAKVDKNGPLSEFRADLGQCWVWRLPGGMEGYGAFYYEGRSMPAHRASYMMNVGPIPKGLVIDHLCHQRNCIRPDHLEAVTGGENTRRAQSWIAGASWQREKTHCKWGHPYSGDNLRICKDGKRACRTCERRYTAEYHARQRELNPVQPKPRKTHCKHGHAYAEFGYTAPDGRRMCRECARRNNRAQRARDKALKGPAPERVTCKNGHPWTDENIYTDPRGHKSCRLCHNEATLARYHATKDVREARAEGKPRRTECANGHPWTPENIHITPDGLEKCRICARDRNRVHAAKRKAALPPAEPKPPRTHCANGHPWTDENTYTTPKGRTFCRTCAREAQERKRNRDQAVTNPAKGAWQRAKETCPAGHPYDDINTYIPPSGGRKCKECIRIRNREFQRDKRAAAKAFQPIDTATAATLF